SSGLAMASESEWFSRAIGMTAYRSARCLGTSRITSGSIDPSARPLRRGARAAEEAGTFCAGYLTRALLSARPGDDEPTIYVTLIPAPLQASHRTPKHVTSVGSRHRAG